MSRGERFDRTSLAPMLSRQWPRVTLDDVWAVLTAKYSVLREQAFIGEHWVQKEPAQTPASRIKATSPPAVYATHIFQK